MKGTLLVFDLNNLLYKGVHVHRLLKSGPYSTGGLFGFVLQFAAQVSLYKPEDVVVCCDAPPYIRGQMFPNYKDRNRKTTPGDLLARKIADENRVWIHEFLSILNILDWSHPGLEADDCMDNIAEYYGKDYKKVVIVSNDSDLYQLFRFGNVLLHRGRVGKYSQEQFSKDFPGITPKEWVKITAISGTHNAVPGIPGYGITKAFKMYKSAKYLQFFIENKNILERNEDLIRLPIKEVTPPEIRKPKIVERKIISYLASFRIVYTAPIRQAMLHLGNGNG